MKHQLFNFNQTFNFLSLPLILLLVLLTASYVNAEEVPARGRFKEKQEKTPEGLQNLITVSKETTFYTEPLDQYGFVDYLAAVNNQLSKGVSAENNAAIDYIKASRPGTDSPDHLEQICKLLSIPVPVLIDHPLDYESVLSKKINELKKSDDNLNIDQTLDSQMAYFNKPWKAVDHPEAKAFLVSYQPTFDLLYSARLKTGYWYPYATSQQNSTTMLVAVLLPHVQEMRSFARALKMKIMLDLGENDFQSAKEDLLTMHALGRNVARGGTLIEQLVGYAITAIAFNADNEFANRCTDLQILQEYRDKLNKLPAARTCIETIDKMERAMGLDIINLMARHEFGSVTTEEFNTAKNLDSSMNNFVFSMNFNWDVLAIEMNQSYDRLITILNAPHQESKILLKEFEQEISEYKNKITNPDMVFWNLMSKKVRSESMAKILSALLLPAIGQVRLAEDANSMREKMVELTLLLNIYNLEQGHYPSSLKELTPKYISEVPQDIFNDTPLKYNSDGKTFTLYSVGRNGKDDGGMNQDNNPEGVNQDDLVTSKK